MSRGLQISAIIPARAGSKGLKDKNIYPVFNKPLIYYTLLQAKMSTMIDSIFVSTNDKRINEISDELDIDIIERPADLCSDTATSESALLHAIEVINNEHLIYPDIIVFLQVTSPLRLIDDIDKSIEQFINEKVDSMFSATRMDDLTLWQKKNDIWKSINFDHSNRLRRQEMPNNYIENGSIYITKPKILKRYNNRLAGKISVYEMQFWQTWEIDTIEEIDLIEYYMKKYKIDKIDEF